MVCLPQFCLMFTNVVSKTGPPSDHPMPPLWGDYAWSLPTSLIRTSSKKFLIFVKGPAKHSVLVSSTSIELTMVCTIDVQGCLELIGLLQFDPAEL